MSCAAISWHALSRPTTRPAAGTANLVLAMNEPGDSTLAATADPQPEAEPPERLTISVVAEAGDWSSFPAVERRIAEAAGALARHRRCRRALGAQATVVLADDALVQSLNATY